MNAPTAEQRLAKLALETTARSVSASLTDYQKWLVAGVGAAVGLLLPKLHELAQLVGQVRTLWVITLLCLAIIFAAISLLLGAQVAAATSTSSDLEKAAVAMTEKADAALNVEVFFAEARSGLWWPALWGFDYGRRSAERGDHVAPGRLVARLSQVQAYLVIGQVLMILGSVVVAAAAAI